MTTEIPPTVANPWVLRLHAVLGGVVITVGFWLMWGELLPGLAAIIALSVAAFLTWRGTTLGRVWGWATLLLGLESLAWSILTMVRVRMDTGEPTDQQMGDMLTAILFGVPSAIFWLSFSYGIFNRVWRQETESRPLPAQGSDGREQKKHRKKERRFR